MSSDAAANPAPAAAAAVEEVATVAPVAAAAASSAAAPATNEAIDFSVKHPLQNTWTMWFDPPQDKRDWKDLLQQINTFSTVEDYWRLMNNLAPPSRLQQGSNYHLFKEGVRPAWEDPQNIKGGKWTIMVDRKKTDPLWLYTLLSLIGEELDAEEEICGAVISIRRGNDKLSVWTKNVENQEAVLTIGKRLKQLLELDENHKMEYAAHSAGKGKSLFL